MDARVQGMQFIDFAPLRHRALEILIDSSLVCAHVDRGESCGLAWNSWLTQLRFLARAMYSIPADLMSHARRSASHCSFACAYIAIASGSNSHFRNTKGPNPSVVP